jgi:hypothetical protein
MDIAAKLSTHMGWPTNTSDWIFRETSATRDSRLDLMRGFVFVILFACHFDYFSIFMYFAWERLGIISSAETFISLAGIVIGIVFGRKCKSEGIAACMPGLVNRAIDLYKINVIVALTVGLLRYVSWINTDPITGFNDPYTGAHYPLYPPMELGVLKLLRDAFLLQCGPHQFQIMGLYAVLFLLAPAILFLLDKRRAKLLSAISCIVYLINFGTPETTPGTAEIRLTGAQFEFGFPFVAWQILFVHAVMAGYYKNEIVAFFSERRNRALIWLAAATSVFFMFFALNHPVDSFPAWSQFTFIPGELFDKIYHGYFAKYNLGPGRLMNQIVLFITVYAALTRFWRPINDTIGWFFIPLGEASLYVFTVHVFLLLAVANSPLPGLKNIWVNTAIHVGTLGLVWLMVKNRFLFRWIPH